MGLNKTNEDWGISSKVRIALKVHPTTEAYIKSLKIGTEKGIVHLMGELPSEEARIAVKKIALTVPEVLSVVDETHIVH